MDPDVGDPIPTMAVAPAASPTEGLATEGTPPAASVAPTTPALATLSEWRRSNMKFRRETIACFEPTKTATIGAGSGKKNKKRLKNTRKNKMRHKKLAKMSKKECRQEESVAIGGEGSAVAEEPKQVAVIKLRYLGLETKSNRPKYCVE